MEKLAVQALIAGVAALLRARYRESRVKRFPGAPRI